jgi:hypothetical protein
MLRRGLGRPGPRRDRVDARRRDRLSQPQGGPRVAGAAAAREHIRAIFARRPTLRLVRCSLRCGDDFAASEWTARAVHPDDWSPTRMGRRGDLPPHAEARIAPKTSLEIRHAAGPLAPRESTVGRACDVEGRASSRAVLDVSSSGLRLLAGGRRADCRISREAIARCRSSPRSQAGESASVAVPRLDGVGRPNRPRLRRRCCGAWSTYPECRARRWTG